MTSPVTKEMFGAMLDEAGLTLSEAQKAELFKAYPMFSAMVVRATPEQPREAEPVLIFHPEVR